MIAGITDHIKMEEIGPRERWGEFSMASCLIALRSSLEKSLNQNSGHIYLAAERHSPNSPKEGAGNMAFSPKASGLCLHIHVLRILERR